MDWACSDEQRAAQHELAAPQTGDIQQHPLRPLRHRLRVKALWSFDRQATAKAAAIGAFFAIATPIAQVVFGLVAAVLLRATLLLPLHQR